MDENKILISGEPFEFTAVEGWFGNVKKFVTSKVKNIAKTTGASLIKDLSPILNIAKKVDPKLLMAINPASGGVKLGFDLLKDIKTTQKETGKEINFGVDNVMKWYEIGFAKGVESQLKKVEQQTAGTQQNTTATNTVVEKVDDALSRSRSRARNITRR